MATIRIRAGRSGDSDEFLKLVDALAEYEHLEPPTREGRKRLLRDIFSKKRIKLLVATDGRELRGYALYFFSYSSFVAKPTLYIEDLFVDQKVRGAGIGLALFRRCAKEAIREKCGRMEWSVLTWNTSAMAFYEKLGARRLGDWCVYRLDEDAIGMV